MARSCSSSRCLAWFGLRFQAFAGVNQRPPAAPTPHIEYGEPQRRARHSTTCQLRNDQRDGSTCLCSISDIASGLLAMAALCEICEAHHGEECSLRRRGSAWGTSATDEPRLAGWSDFERGVLAD